MIREEQIMTDAHDEAIPRALVGIDKVWAEVRRTPWVERDLGLPVDRLPDISEAAVAGRSSRASDALAGLALVDLALLPTNLRLTCQVAQLTASRMASEAGRYWL